MCVCDFHSESCVSELLWLRVVLEPCWGFGYLWLPPVELGLELAECCLCALLVTKGLVITLCD